MELHTEHDPSEAIETISKERDDFLALAKSIQADFENYQKRIHRDTIKDKHYTVGPLALDILPVLDNLERALQTKGMDVSVMNGLCVIRNQLLLALKRHDIIKIDAKGRQFDPDIHDCIMVTRDENVPTKTVLEVHEEGFMIFDRVLRPSKVSVSQ